MYFLYFSDIDMTLPDGPSVNELVFCKTLLENYPDTRFVLPTGNKSLSFLNHSNTLFYVPAKRKFLSISYWLNALKVANTIRLEYENHTIDLVISRMTALPATLYVLITFFKVPVSLKSQGRFWFDKENRNWQDKIYLCIDEFLSSACLRHAKAIDTVTPQAKKTLTDIASKTPLCVIENAANVEDFSITKDKRKYKEYDFSCYDCVIGYIGTFPSQRGLKQLITYAKNNKQKNFVYLIAGEDEDIAEHKKEIEKDNLSNRFFFLGHVPYDDIPDVMSCIDIGVSFDDIERAKIIGNSSQKVRQYLSAGCPCISINIGNEFLEEHDLGSRVDPQDDKAIESTIDIWHVRLNTEGESLRTHIRQYALDHLSAKAALKKRIEFWSALQK